MWCPQHPVAWEKSQRSAFLLLGRKVAFLCAMSKRKAEPAPGSKVTGKQRMDSTLEQDLDPGDGLDILLGGAEGNESDLLPNPEDVEGSDDDALAEALGSEFDDVLPSAATGVDAIAFDETVGEMPDGLSDEQVEQPEEVDLSTYELTLPQARRVAESLARNGGLSSVRFSDHTLSVGDLKEEDELEWDSEEYTDVDAVCGAPSARACASCARSSTPRSPAPLTLRPLAHRSSSPRC